MSHNDATARADLAQELIREAAYLAMAVRDRDPADIAQRLRGLTRHELEALAVVLAAMVDPDRSVHQALGWIDFDEHGRPLEQAPRRDGRALRRVARDPEPSTAGPDYAAAVRALEGERIELRGIDRTLAVAVAARWGWTKARTAAVLGMTETAVGRSWERTKRRRKAVA
jgi:hypothetical protein